MFRPIVTIILALALAVLAGCADAPPRRTGSSLPPPSGAIPAPASPGAARPAVPPATAAPSSETDLLTDTNRAESCRERCERSYRICGDSTAATKEDLIGSLGNPRPFSRADDCQFQLGSCLKRCDTTP